MKKQETQADQIRRYVRQNGSITTMEAFFELGITKLATRISEMIRDLPDENLKPTISTSAVKKGIVASNAYTITLILSVPPPSPAANSYYHLMIIPHMGYYGAISF